VKRPGSGLYALTDTYVSTGANYSLKKSEEIVIQKINTHQLRRRTGMHRDCWPNTVPRHVALQNCIAHVGGPDVSLKINCLAV
jgi:hypothetical protein